MKRKFLVAFVLTIGMIIGLTVSVKGSTDESVGNISITKVAPGGGPQLFQFDGDLGLMALADGYTGTQSNIPAGDYTIYEELPLPTNWLLTDVSCVGGDSTPFSDAIGQGVTVHLEAGEHITCTFTNIQTGDITAHKFNDRNGNGVLDAGEESLSDWTMKLYSGSGCNDTWLASSVTDESGNVGFVDVIPGNYSVEETLQSGWQNTTELCQDVTLLPGGSEIINFGNQQEAYISIDINPGSCPNPLALKSKGVLPVAILGLDDFDVTQIDPATVTIFRKEIPDPVHVFPLRWSLEDAGIPYEPFIGKISANDCLEYHPDDYGVFDGYLDLSFTFKVGEVVNALGDVSDGEVIVLQLTGKLKEEFGGTKIVGEDIVWIRNK